MNFPPDQKHLFYSELAKLTGAGFSVVDAADTLLDQKLPPAQERYLKGLKTGVIDRSETIAEAIDAITLVPITPLEKSITSAAEKGGQLQQGFQHLADYFQMLHRARRRIRAGLIYPLVLLHAGILLPAAVKIILAPVRGPAIKETLIILFSVYVIVAVGFFLFKNLVQKASHSASADAWLRKIPLVGKVRYALAMSRFCKVHQIYLLSGQRMDAALLAAAHGSQSGLILESIKTEVIPEVIDGQHAGPFLDKKVFQPAFVRSYVTAEEAGSLDTDMARWSALSQEDAVQRMDQLAAAAPKVVYAVVAIFVIYQIFTLANTYYFGPIKTLLNDI